jgi:predicted metal-dependent hydrolase
MTEIVTLAGPPVIAVTLRRAAGLRRLSLRVSGLDQKVTLSVPRHLPQSEALSFLTEKEGWLRAALARGPNLTNVGLGSVIPFRGVPVEIVAHASRALVLADGRLHVPADPAGTQTARRVVAFLRDRARAALVPAAQRYAAELSRPITAITLRDTRSRWGSCTADGRLMFSWRLIMAPPVVLEYVAAHEAAHLAHMDHSPAYWACVARLMPDYAAHRAWLRANGTTLHGYQFGS